MEAIGMQPPWPGGWRYSLGALGGWLLFLMAVFGAAYGRAVGWSRPVILGLAFAPSLIAAVQFIVAYRLIAAQDEFVRGLYAKRFLIAGGGVVLVAVAWSGAETVGARHMPGWLLYPLFFGLFGALSPLVKASRS
jgi:hypothetical protein